MLHRTITWFTGLLVITSVCLVAMSSAASSAGAASPPPTQMQAASLQAATSTTTTAVLDVATGKTWANTETTGASAMQSATVSGQTGVTPTGTVSYALYTNGSCTGTATAEGTNPLNAGVVANSN